MQAVGTCACSEYEVAVEGEDRGDGAGNSFDEIGDEPSAVMDVLMIALEGSA